jgi:hypothetical protein
MEFAKYKYENANSTNLRLLRLHRAGPSASLDEEVKYFDGKYGLMRWAGL